MMNKQLIERWKNKAVTKPTQLLNVKGDAAEVYLYDVIGSDMFGGISAKQFADELKNFKGNDLTVRVNSPGGDVFDGLAMYALLNSFSGKKTVIIDGLAASIASVIAMAGDQVLMQPEAEMMVHKAWTVAQGNAADLMKMAEQLQGADEKISAVYQRKTGMDPTKLDALMAEETWMSAAQATEMKFADAVCQPKKKAKAQAVETLTKISPIEVLRLRAGLVGKP